MKVLINGHILTVGWNYESKIIEKACKRLGISRDALRGKSKREICAFLNLKSFPIPEKTVCVIMDEATGDRFVGIAKRFHKDPWNRDKARRETLTRALWQLFPEGGINGGIHNEEQSTYRSLFWEAYNNRIEKNQNILQNLVKAGKITLEDIKNYANQHHVVTFAK